MENYHSPGTAASRRFRRLNTNGINMDCDIFGLPTAFVRNISIGGVSVLTDRPIATGESFRMHVSYNGTEYRLEGNVVWSRTMMGDRGGKMDSALFYKAGIKFRTGYLHQSAEVLSSLLASGRYRQRY